jgi:hypothetical protein
VHLLEAGVEVNVIRGSLGHVNLATTNRYPDIKMSGSAWDPSGYYRWLCGAIQSRDHGRRNRDFRRESEYRLTE